MFDFPPAIRKAIYTTNAIESVNSVIRKFTRNRKQYPNEESALEARVHGNPRGVQEVDNADPKLETSIEPLRHHLREPTSSSGPELSPHAKFVPTRADTKKFTGPNARN